MPTVTPPSFIDISCYRSDSSKTASDSGTYITISFSWKSETSSRNYWRLRYRKVDEPTTWYNYNSFNYNSLTSSTSGTQSSTLIGGSIDTNSSYLVEFTIRDGNNAVSTATRIIPSQKFLIDCKHDSKGDGVAIGKVAENTNLLDVGYPIKFSGGIKNEVIYDYTDLNDIKTPNTYVSNSSTASYQNVPSELASSSYITFTLEVISAGDDKQIYQRLTTTEINQRFFMRCYFAGGSGPGTSNWAWTQWVRMLDSKDVNTISTNVATSVSQSMANTVKNEVTSQLTIQPGTLFNITLHTGGYITTEGTQIYFSIPLAKYIPDNVNNIYVYAQNENGVQDLEHGFILRAGGSYLGGSGSQTWTWPYRAYAFKSGNGNFLNVELDFGSNMYYTNLQTGYATQLNTAQKNALTSNNNSACGIVAKIRLGFFE